jgi:hypothetical protein
MEPRTLFVYKRAGLDTAEIRGRQIAAELGCDTLWLPELTADVAAGYDAIIYVKRAPSPDLIDTIRARGIRQALDVLDNYSSWRLRRSAPLMDLLIGANITHAVHLQRTYGVPGVEIPHHHCNFDQQRIPFRTAPLTLGFISTPGPWPENRKLVAPLGLPIVANVSRRGNTDPLRALADAYLSVDVGFTWRMDSNKLRFNCANKLTNFMSFGIPSVLTPESGYLEFGRHGETVLYAHDRKDFVALLQWLVEDDGLRRRMGDACYESARPFHISRIADRYREMLRQLV